MATLLSPQEMQRDVKVLRHSSLVQHHEFVCMLRAVDRHSRAEGGGFAGATHGGGGGGGQGSSQTARNLSMFYTLLLRMLLEVSKNQDRQKQRGDLKRVFDWFGTNKVLFAGARDSAAAAMAMGEAGRRSPDGRVVCGGKTGSPVDQTSPAGGGLNRSSNTSPTEKRLTARVAGSRPSCSQEDLQSSIMITKLTDHGNQFPAYQPIIPAVTTLHSLTNLRSASRSHGTGSQTSMTASFLSRSPSPSDTPGQSALPPVRSCSPPDNSALQPESPPRTGFEDDTILDSFSTVRLSSPEPQIHVQLIGGKAAGIRASNAENYSRHALNANASSSGQRRRQQQQQVSYHKHSQLRVRSPVTANKVYAMVDGVSERMSERMALMETRRLQIRHAARKDPEPTSRESAEDERQPGSDVGGQAPKKLAAGDEAPLKLEENGATAETGDPARVASSASDKSPPQQSTKTTAEQSQLESSRPISSMSTGAEVRRVTIALPSHIKSPTGDKPSHPNAMSRKPYQQRLWRQVNRPGSATARVAYPDLASTQSTPDLTYNNTRQTKSRRLQPPAKPKPEVIQSLMQVRQLARTTSPRSARTMEEKKEQDLRMQGYLLTRSAGKLHVTTSRGKRSVSPSSAAAEYMKLAESVNIQQRSLGHVPSPPATSQVSLDHVQPSEVSDVHLAAQSHQSSTLTYLTSEEGPQAPPASAATFDRGPVTLLSDECEQIVMQPDQLEDAVLETPEYVEPIQVLEVSIVDVELSPSPEAAELLNDETEPAPQENAKRDAPRLLVSTATIDEPDDEAIALTAPSMGVGTMGLTLKPNPNQRTALQSSSCGALPDPRQRQSKKATGDSPKTSTKSRHKTVGDSQALAGKLSPVQRRRGKSPSKSPEPQRRNNIRMNLSSQSESRIASLAMSSGYGALPITPRQSAKANAAVERQRREKAAIVVQKNLRKFLSHKKRMSKNLAVHSIRANQSWTEEQLLERKDFELRKRQKAEEEQRQKAREIGRHNKFKKELQQTQAHSDIQTIFRPKLPSAKEKRDAAICLQRIARGFLQRRAMEQCYLLTAEPGIPPLRVLVGECKALFKAVRAFHNVKACEEHVLTFRELKRYTDTRVVFQKAFNAVDTDGTDVVLVKQLKDVFAQCDKAPSWKEMRTAARSVLDSKQPTPSDTTSPRQPVPDTAAEAQSLDKGDADQLQSDSNSEISSEADSSYKKEERESSTELVKPKSALVRLDAQELSCADFVQLAFNIYVPDGCGLEPTSARKSTWMNPIVNGEEAAALQHPSVIGGTDLQACLDLVAKARQERDQQGIDRSP